MVTAKHHIKSQLKPTVRVARFHSALVGGYTLKAIAGRAEHVAVFFRLGDLNSACGIATLCIVFSVLSLVKASALEAMPQRKYGLAAEIWRALKHTYFTGMRAPELCAAVQSLGMPLRLTMRHVDDSTDAVGHRAVADFALASLRRGRLVMIAYRCLRDRHQHWLLAVGVGGLETRRSVDWDTIFVLDSSIDLVKLATYNSTLTRVQRNDTPHPAWNLECSAGYVIPVTLLSAVRFDPT